MSKSLGNCIYLSEEPEEIKKKVFSMFTDPTHIRVEDPGNWKETQYLLILMHFADRNILQSFAGIFGSGRAESTLSARRTRRYESETFSE